MGRKPRGPAVYPCRYNVRGCNVMLARPGGVKRHGAACDFNPANQRKPPTPSPTPSPSPPPATFSNPPSPQQPPLGHSFDNARYETPPPQDQAHFSPATPSQSSPRRNVWTTRGRPGILVRDHPMLSGDPVDCDGYTLPKGTPPPPEEPDKNPLWPFASPEHMMLADFLYSKVQMSQGDVDYLMKLWDAMQRRFLTEQFGPDFDIDMDEHTAPFPGHLGLLSTIDSIPHGDIP
ncbi:hypothetical protein NMY22_g13249 [Coprinellus aureogranulatus]|nr:hypothetical protein NMY22_g13249 [Coprinellus aureogranulatus]